MMMLRIEGVGPAMTRPSSHVSAVGALRLAHASATGPRKAMNPEEAHRSGGRVRSDWRGVRARARASLSKGVRTRTLWRVEAGVCNQHPAEEADGC